MIFFSDLVILRLFLIEWKSWSIKENWIKFYIIILLMYVSNDWYII